MSLPTFRLRCDFDGCPVNKPDSPLAAIPSYREAATFAEAHEWIWNGTEGFSPKHKVEIIEYYSRGESVPAPPVQPL